MTKQVNRIISGMPKYTEIRRALNIEVGKGTDDTLAPLTHYLHSWDNGSAHLYKKDAIQYVNNHDIPLSKKEKELFTPFLPIEWDVPFPPPEKYKFKFIDLFAGIGGFRIAFQNLGGKCVFTSEWNHFAQKTYEANFGEVPFGDITKIDEKLIPDHDILVGGFPCQPFSIAGVSKKNALGKEHGFKDETQGTLFFDIVRIIEAKKPKAFLLENVKNLVSHDKGNTFKVISKALKSLGYEISYKVLDGSSFVPQHRERIIIVGFRSDIDKKSKQFEFPILPSRSPSVVEDVLESKVDNKYTLTDKLWLYLQNYAAKHKEKGNGFGFGLVKMDGITRTLSARYYKDGSEILIPQVRKNPRRLTPRECARIQGFPDEFIIPVSDNQAYRQFGNSVVVPLMQAVGNEMVNKLINSKNVKDSSKRKSQ
jgi:DNA (cytosine-5)-methyltransferase 1